MLTFTDLTIVSDCCYKLSELILSGHYNNIFYYEFHQEVDPESNYNSLEGLKAFTNRSQDFYEIFISTGWIDEFPARIHIALKVGDEWFIARDIGSNFYLGYGPTGILKLREACSKKKITAFAPNENFDDWIKNKFEESKIPNLQNPNYNDTIQFEKLCETIRLMTSEIQRRPEQYQGLTEENIRDRMLTPINIAFNGRGNAESKNRKGKTDILVRTEDGLNEHIFELKVWSGIKTIEQTIEQILSYISWHNNYCGIIIFCYNKNYSAILNATEKFLKEKFGYNKRKKYLENEFCFRLTHQTDSKKTILTNLFFINLRT